MSEYVKITRLVYPVVTVKRGDTIATGSEMQVWLDDFLFVRIGYDHRYVDNATQWRMAEQIAAAFREPQEPRS